MIVVRTLAVALLCVILLPVTHARACTCAQAAQGVEKARDAATAVFEGVVTHLRHNDLIANATFRIVQTWKGTDGEQVTVLTAQNPAACGVNFKKGTSYLVYAQDREGTLQVSSCSRTAPADDARDDLTTLGAGITPVNIHDDGPSELSKLSSPARCKRASGGCAGCTTTRSSPVPVTFVLIPLVLSLWSRRIRALR